MIKLYLITSIAAISFFSFAQYRGMTLFGGGAQQQFAKAGGSGIGSGSSRSSSISHK
jgi:hypothetical protein